MNANTKTIIALTVVSVLLSGCLANAPERPDDPHYAPVMLTTDRAQPPLNGSLFSDNRTIDLFGDTKARRIGDIVTVVLEERTSSSKSSNIGVVKDNEISIDPAGTGTLLGNIPQLKSMGLGTSLGGEREFTGEAEADQSNRLTGNITVTVVDRYPNGTLVIRGEKWLTLNRGNEFIRISGLVRPDDISPDNMVMSTKIANARITYSGTGELADAQKMGWLSRFFNSPIWPF